MVAAFLDRDGRHARADRRERRGNLASAPVDGALVEAWRLEPDEPLEAFAQPRGLLVAPAEESRQVHHVRRPGRGCLRHNSRMLRAIPSTGVLVLLLAAASPSSAQTPAPFP